MAISSNCTTLTWDNSSWTLDSVSGMYYKDIITQAGSDIDDSSTPILSPLITTVDNKGSIELAWSAIVEIETLSNGYIRFFSVNTSLVDTLLVLGPNGAAVTILVNGY